MAPSENTEERPGAERAPWVLRPATAADAQAIAAIYNASLRTRPYQADEAGEAEGARWLADQMAQVRDLSGPPISHYLGPMSVRMALHVIDAHARNRRHLIVACEGRDLVGWLGSHGMVERPGLSTVLEFAYYVAPRWRRRGVARALLDHAFTHATEWGVDRLLAMVWSDNTASLSLLARAGFERWGLLPGAVTAFGKRRDMVMLGRVLQDDASHPAR